ncbi:MAG TPA: UDP-N-acetylglucosamine 2-epimerase (non-hydrolyzing) [Polyangiaceae bacterium]|nr:UDP-N-acetylglucosamine 2-epimerase (non-hydrolyzing) [Polyangiaceae bacterium]
MAFKILCVAGARPNFMKIAPILRAFGGDPRFEAKLVHTGQHYDAKLSKVFFEDLKIPRPDIELEVGSGSHAQQTAEVMRRFEPILEAEQPHGVLVVGDVNSTVGCAVVTSKYFLREPYLYRGRARQRPLMIHVEAGLRSFDDDMPEEINRKLTDAVSDLLYVSDPSGTTNLAKEGVAEERWAFVGNVMIDTLLAARSEADKSRVLADLGLEAGSYGLVTLHRPSNVDDPVALRKLLGTLLEIAKDLRLVFPVHPRTRKRLEDAGIQLDPARFLVVDPQGYLDFMKLTASAKCVLTDSGGVQEETTVLGVPCITLRENTERPVTCEEGTNQLAGVEREAILAAYARIDEVRAAGKVPRFWDGKSAARIVAHLGQLLDAPAAPTERS